MIDIFSSFDVAELKENPHDDTKIRLVNKLARNYNGSHLNPEERIVADEILKLLARDISSRIKIALSEKFCQNENIPYEVVLQLSHDMEDFVSVPMIQFSKLLKEEDLVNIVKTKNGEKQRAVARRDDLGNIITNTIIQYGEGLTVAALAENESAKLTRDQNQKILQLHQRNFEVVKSMIESKRIDDDGTLEIIMASSEKLKQLIVSNYKISPSTVGKIVQESKESTILSMIRANIDKPEKAESCEAITDKLFSAGEINFPLIIKALSIGATNFFYSAFAKIVQLPKDNIIKVVDEGGAEGVEKLFMKAKFPPQLASPTMELLEIVKTNKKASISSLDMGDIANQLRNSEIAKTDKNTAYLYTIISY